MPDAPSEIPDSIQIDLKLVIREPESLMDKKPVVFPRLIDHLKIKLSFDQIAPFYHNSLIFFFLDRKHKIL